MIIDLQYHNTPYSCDLSQPIDISIPIGKVRCFFAEEVTFVPYESGDFIGSVKQGAPVNFYNVFFNPHGNGTHTEGMGHITLDQESVIDSLNQYHFIAKVISVDLETTTDGDQIISEAEIKKQWGETTAEAIVIRTLPNSSAKQTRDYSGTNPPYLSAEAMSYMVDNGVKHLLIDLPSVDREEDDGQLANHKLFWKVKGVKSDANTRKDATITELIYVPDTVIDGLYLLNIQVPTIELDAVPSKPVLYSLKPKNENDDIRK